jgi:Asp-tRNA(Asn)/Glu-tRNA(Gln) amidotransferase A subunit family amidase
MLSLLLVAALMQDPAEAPFPTAEDLRSAAHVLGLEFEEEELAQMRAAVVRRIGDLERIRAFPLAWDESFSLGFDPLLPGVSDRSGDFEIAPIELPRVERPEDLSDLAFADIPTLAALVKLRRVSCVELAELFLGRLEEYDAKLHCVVTLTPERARARAAELDRELDEGKWRGLLHGIPYGAKDLLSVAGYPTTWGAKPYAEQRLEQDASVIARLDEAGAVLVAKLSLGALAMGDEWFRGRTNNPWNPERGSSGSSAGSASATAAGLVPFAIGSETLGSIVSPSVRCANSSLRPTFGRVPRGGAMPLSWTMDKLGVLSTSAVNCAIAFDAIHGQDGIDPDAVRRPFRLSAAVDVKGWRVGYFSAARDGQEDYARTLGELEALGVELVALELPDYPVWEMMLILMVEAASSFDELTRDGRDDQLVQQGDDAWPNLFRAARLIPAVEYVRANRLRTALCRAMDAVMAQVELYVHPPSYGSSLGITNLTGHPCVVAPSGPAREGRQPRTMCFTGQLYGEDKLLALVQTWQAASGYHRQHPPGY